MKWINTVLACLLFGLAGMASADEKLADTPLNYAFGMTLITPGHSPWSRLPLPEEVYQQSVWPDLRDIRVFDQRGDTVPFTLAEKETGAPITLDIPFHLFPLDRSPITHQINSGSNATGSFFLRADNGVEIQFDRQKNQSSGQYFLLTPAEERRENTEVSQLKFDWSTSVKNWQGKVSVYSSDDLRHWVKLAENAPLLDLAEGSSRLKMDTVDVDSLIHPQTPFYLLLVFDDTTPPLTLNQVNVKGGNVFNLKQPEQIKLAAAGRRLSDTQAVWQWSRPQRLTSLDIELVNDGVLPVELSWRSSEQDEWHAFNREVLYRVKGRFSPAIMLPAEPIQAVRVTTINSRLPDEMPLVQGEHIGYQLIFLTQGKAPYLMALGNSAAEQTSVSFDMLIPAALREGSDLEWIPQAEINERITLGGKDRLITVPIEKSDSQRNTPFIWGILLIGVMVLLFMVWRIWRDVQKKTSP